MREGWPQKTHHGDRADYNPMEMCGPMEAKLRARLREEKKDKWPPLYMSIMASVDTGLYGVFTGSCGRTPHGTGKWHKV